MNSEQNPFAKADTLEQPEVVKTHVTEQEANYWAEFYSRTDFHEGSSFYEFINDIPNLPETVIDIGCGQGRDSFAFASAGRRVIGIDRSDVGVQHANQHAVESSLDSRLQFAVCDVSDEQNLTEALDKAREAANGGNICYYMRFFLHSVPEDVQEALLKTIATYAKPGDVFTAEFRTDKDEQQDKVFGKSHYRRYQNAEEFSARLRGEYGWDNIVYETEGQGLSPYGDEDPVLYRVVAIHS